MAPVECEILTIDAESSHLDAVIQLGDARSQWTGFYPHTAFGKRAAKGDILVAVDHTAGTLLGYLMYYVARGRAVIQQLCVQDGHEGSGVGRRLVDELKARTRHLDGISLHCKRSFPAHSFWPKVGFLPVGEKIGRGVDRKPLTRFWYDHGHPDLFSAVHDEKRRTTLTVVVDANIVFNLAEASASPEAHQASALNADWLQEEVSLWITDELLREIDKCEDGKRRKASRSFASGFPRIRYDPARQDEVLSLLDKLIPPAKTESDVSDRRHLAAAIAGGADFFVTQDRGITKWRGKVTDDFSIGILRPVEFVTRIDEWLRESEYYPARLAGSSVRMQRLTAEGIDGAIQAFLAHDAGEKKSDLRRRVDHSLACPTHAKGLQINAADGKPLALVVIQQEGDAVYNIPILRIHRHRLSGTLARYLLVHCILESVGANRAVTVVADPYLSPVLPDALRELGFQATSETWVKVNLPGCVTTSRLRAHLDRMCSPISACRAVLEDLEQDITKAQDPAIPPQALAAIERRLFPVRILDDRIPNYIVPIQPRWAMELFDARLAQEHLLGADDFLSLRCENVYYRSGYIPVVSAPGHVLWYVSEGRGASSGPSSIRACSNILETALGDPRELFGRFRRLGVYRLGDVQAIGSGNKKGRALAFRFGGTETFADEIKLEALRAILSEHTGAVPPFSMPVRIPVACFQEIYEHGSSPQL